MKKRAVNKQDQKTQDYSSFDKVNGKHSFQSLVPEGCVKYKARIRPGGKLAYFNFDLAKEMGLVSNDHPYKISKDLEKKFLETFSLIIINEYDIIHEKKFPKNMIKENEYMATRYLQLQHPNKKGKTSGDGRSIWNGEFKGKRGAIWDISSCGTGATKLSPATHINNKFYESGDPSISYGCGYSELDEGLEALLMSEVFHKNGINTERLLGIIEFPNNIAIHIRAYTNLLRPSHFFCHLKQNNYDALKNVFEYYCTREILNSGWDVTLKSKRVYDVFLEQVCRNFAKMSAIFEDEYIFCWLDWDGDNILMDGGIIDYGSVRQFGMFHGEYRYDDVERYSTTIKEQKAKAKYIVQTFIQLVDYLKTKEKSPIEKFSKHPVLKKFDEIFEYYKNINLLSKVGYSKKDVEYLIENHLSTVISFRKDFSYFERSKSKKGLENVSDGINWSAIYCMRDLLRELPQIYLSNNLECVEANKFIEIAKSSYAIEEDLIINDYKSKKIKQYQRNYIKLLKYLAKRDKKDVKSILLEITMRSSVINKYDRITGDSITSMVYKLLHSKPKLSPIKLNNIVTNLREYQNFDPDTKVKTKDNVRNDKFVSGLFKLISDYREGL